MSERKLTDSELEQVRRILETVEAGAFDPDFIHDLEAVVWSRHPWNVRSGFNSSTEPRP